MIFVKKDIFEEIGKIFVESFALLVAMMLLLLGIADARVLHFGCTIATVCIVAVSFSFFFNRIICCRQLREKENCFNDTLLCSCKAVFASFENKKKCLPTANYSKKRENPSYSTFSINSEIEAT